MISLLPLDHRILNLLIPWRLSLRVIRHEEGVAAAEGIVVDPRIVAVAVADLVGEAGTPLEEAEQMSFRSIASEEVAEEVVAVVHYYLGIAAVVVVAVVEGCL